MRGGRNYAAQGDPSHNPQFGRRWTEPQHIAEIAKTPAEDTGRQAISHHLAQAAKLDGPEAEAAFEIADNIRATMGLTWADLVGQRRAA